MRNPTEIIIENGEDGPRSLPLALNEDRKRTERGFLPKLLRVAGRIPFADDLAAAYYAAIDPATPKKTKAVLFAALGYFVVPTDALPDFIVGFGFTDDATVLMAALSIVGNEVRERHRLAARKLLRLPEPPAEDVTPSA
ncbi:YkvA family protein [Henriciella litoralis]|uniref:YkvA family protein n=1 Tax=Henriciella litoralis TaxID=568102 RepID=UPI000A007C1E|nr:YkvA family protein [Henriciella litoralis]